MPQEQGWSEETITVPGTPGKGWGEDDLSKYLERTHRNQKANFAICGGGSGVLSGINDCFARGGKYLTNAKPMMAAFLFLRCQYAFKTAVGLAYAGQVVEAFVMSRSILEYAGYALMIFDRPELEEVFALRHAGEAEMKKQKDEFTAGAAKRAVKAFDKKLGQIYEDLYQRSIDFGGHPNPNAVFSAMKMEPKGDPKDGAEITVLSLTTDATLLTHAWKSVAQSGLTALYIFRRIFKEKFELLGLSKMIDELSAIPGL